jgi:hypothetical protein
MQLKVLFSNKRFLLLFIVELIDLYDQAWANWDAFHWLLSIFALLRKNKLTFGILLHNQLTVCNQLTGSPDENSSLTGIFQTVSHIEPYSRQIVFSCASVLLSSNVLSKVLLNRPLSLLHPTGKKGLLAFMEFRKFSFGDIISITIVIFWIAQYLDVIFLLYCPPF